MTKIGELHNPSTGELSGNITFAQEDDVNAAVAKAHAAFPAWAATPPIQRARILFKFKTLIEKHLDDLAKIITREHGKLPNDARGSLWRGLEVVEFVCGISDLLKGAYSENINAGIDHYTIRQPLGVCIGITPFNFPAMLPLWMFPMAIACGNTFVLKPSEKDPSVSIRLAELMHEAGLPEGVLNVIQGDKETVELLIKHPEVVAVSFIGSTPIAEHVYKTASQYHKRVQAFGSGKNHAVVMPDVDLDHVADLIVNAAYGSSGERCMALSVVLAIGDNEADSLLAKITPRVEALKVGSDNDADFGPLISKEHLQRVKNYIDQGVEEGATLIVDGRKNKIMTENEGYFLGASLFDNVTPKMRIYQEEIFGPVLVIVRVPDFNTALQMVNAHPYGNSAVIFTKEGGVARQFASQAKAGTIGINVPIPVPAPTYSFGGWKHSVFGDTRLHGMEGVNFYTQLKTVVSRW